MNRASAIAAGSGAIAFGVLFMAALFLTSPAGGNYSAQDIAAYIDPGHIFTAGAGWFLSLLSVTGLIALFAYLRQAAETAPGVNAMVPRLVWGLGLAGAACFAVGWGMVIGQPIAHAEAMTTISVPPMVTYVIVELSSTMLFGSAPMLVGLGMGAMALGSGALLPGWLRWSTLAIGLLATTSLAYFTFFPLLLWSVVTGVWLLVTGGFAEPRGRPESAASSGG